MNIILAYFTVGLLLLPIFGNAFAVAFGRTFARSPPSAFIGVFILVAGWLPITLLRLAEAVAAKPQE